VIEGNEGKETERESVKTVMEMWFLHTFQHDNKCSRNRWRERQREGEEKGGGYENSWMWWVKLRLLVGGGLQ